MVKVIIDGKDMTSEQQMHQLLSQELDFPEWYGGNLDALYDCLTDLTDDVEITVVKSDELIAKLGERALLMLTVLRDAAAENKNIKISVIS